MDLVFQPLPDGDPQLWDQMISELASEWDSYSDYYQQFKLEADIYYENR